MMDQEAQENIYESLETLKEADEYYKWLCSRVQPYIHGKVLEIGSGIGNFAKWARNSSKEYHVSDADPALVKRLESDFPIAFQWDLYQPFPRDDRYDTIIILNVIEHLENDVDAAKKIHEKLVPGGHLIVMVPAMQFLYGSLDKAFGHFRRYTRSTMQSVIKKASFQVVKSEYVNVVGMFGWFLYGKILRRNQLPQKLCSHFNLVIPLLKLERPLAHFTGLSLIMVAQK
jgi:2-polyprenyl-3-methyl-5-hydroxy-6-metoxy-1,4-benzoquinol methylase